LGGGGEKKDTNCNQPHRSKQKMTKKESHHRKPPVTEKRGGKKIEKMGRFRRMTTCRRIGPSNMVPKKTKRSLSDLVRSGGIAIPRSIIHRNTLTKGGSRL